MGFEQISVKVDFDYSYDRDFVRRQSSDYISPTGSIFQNDLEVVPNHKIEKSNINETEAEKLNNELIKSL